MAAADAASASAPAAEGAHCRLNWVALGSATHWEHVARYQCDSKSFKCLHLHRSLLDARLFGTVLAKHHMDHAFDRFQVPGYALEVRYPECTSKIISMMQQS